MAGHRMHGYDFMMEAATVLKEARLEIFKNLFNSVAEEMGVALERASYSPNIKERKDFSCALFDEEGRLVAQAAHIPVHLGSMPLSVLAAIDRFDDFRPGDVVVLNDPYMGGTHLPDITLVTPIFLESDAPNDDRPAATPGAANDHDPAAAVGTAEQIAPLVGFAASRAHHADVGGSTPGSMPVSRDIFQEGVRIPPVKLYAAGEENQGVMDLLLANVRVPRERRGDLRAQVAANRRGALRLAEITRKYGRDETRRYMTELLDYTAAMTRAVISDIPDGCYPFEDVMDDDGVQSETVPIRVKLEIQGDRAVVDFRDSNPMVAGPINCVRAVTVSAVCYVFQCLMPAGVPPNGGALRAIDVLTTPGTVVDAVLPAPVSAGNVETSQRLVDVLLGAMAQALPGRIPAASAGSMNNTIIGGYDPRRDEHFAYYETVAGGMGARPWADGLSAVHTHMTNTKNTPVEALEYAYPLRVVCYEVRRGSGGAGRYRGGDGVRRDVQALVPCDATLVTERRTRPPYGLEGGAPGAVGENVLIRQGEERRLSGKTQLTLETGDILSVRTPGGGGYGDQQTRQQGAYPPP